MIARLARPVLLLAATTALGACSTYGGFGSTGVSVGYSSGGYYPYGYSPYSDYGSSYPYYGWYDGFYYPGAGYYIYDSYGRRYRWSDRHRHYWEGRRHGYRDRGENWGGYRRDRDGRFYDGQRRGDGRDHSRDRDWQRRNDDGRSWQRRDRDDREEGRNWQRRDRDGETSRGRDNRQSGNRAGNREGNPQVTPQRPSRPEVSRPRANPAVDRPRTNPKEAREGRPKADRGRKFGSGLDD